MVISKRHIAKTITWRIIGTLDTLLLAWLISSDFEVELKNDDSSLTKADIESNLVITKYLSTSNIPILSKEGKEIPFKVRKEWNQLWIVDPIDGTKEFIKHNGEFTVNIALIENQKPILGVILVPATCILYFSIKHIGAFKTTIDLEKSVDTNHIVENARSLPITRDDDIYTVVASRSHRSKATDDYVNQLQNKHGNIKTISKGSSLKICMVAEGKADCYPRFAPTMEWDTAAGQAICEHAGFEVIDWETKQPMLYNREQLLNNWFFGSKKGLIHHYF